MRKQTLWCFLCFFFTFSFCLPSPGPDTHLPKFVEGTIDLRENFFAEGEMVYLVGEWELYFGEYLYPPLYGPKNRTGFLEIPDSWQGQTFAGEELPRLGKVTLRCKILLSTETVGQELRLFIPDIASAYRLYANNVLLGGQGKPGINVYDDSPRIKNKYYTLIPDEPELELIFHISNYYNNFGGFWGVPILGNKNTMDRKKMLAGARDIFLVGALSLISLYHLGLYFFRRKEKSIFFFAVFCLVLALRISFTGERFVLELFPTFPWGLAFRIEFLTYYFAVPFFLLFISSLFPSVKNSKLIAGILIFSFVFSLTLFLPIPLFTLLLNAFQLVALVSIGIVLRINIQAIQNREPNSRLFFIGLCILAFSVGLDIIRHTLNARAEGITPYGLLGFIFIQALILSNRISIAFTRAEELAMSLRISNDALVAVTENLESMVLDRTEKLNNSLQRIKKDLLLAKKIQQKILPQANQELGKLKIDLYFQPQNEVGGDFYDIFALDENTVRIFLADATGHGIQAALYTMAIKSEYEAVKQIITKTDDLMNHLNQKIQKKFSGLKIVFTGFLLDIDSKEGQLYYTSAGHPDQILYSKNGMTLLERTGNIIGLKADQSYTQKKIPFGPKDRILLFTDGILEQKNERREEFGMIRLRTLFESLQNKDLDRCISELVIALFQFQGKQEQEDDQTILCIGTKDGSMKTN